MANVSQNVGINSVCFAVLHVFGEPFFLLIPLNLFQQYMSSVHCLRLKNGAKSGRIYPRSQGL